MSVTLVEIVNRTPVLLFDLFHTLTNAAAVRTGPMTHEILGVSYEAWHDQLFAHSRARLAGEERDPVAIIRNLARAIDPSIPDAVIEKAARARLRRFELALIDVPDVSVRTLSTLRRRGKRLVLVSNADVTEITAWDRCPLAPLFDRVIFSCSVGHVKPEPAIYRAALDGLDVVPGDALFVGDGGSNELAGARRAGLITVMMAGIIRELWPERVAPRLGDADFVIEKLDELVSR